jgi:pimeloyl-ACP methyl ester carboxylesterase
VTELETGWVIADGAPVYYRYGGLTATGEPILHVHGFAISGTYMTPTAELLTDEHPTYVPDLPGFGRSPAREGEQSIDGLADTATAFLDAVGVERAVVVGNSLGTAILASLATRHRERVAKVVLVSPAGGKHSIPLPRAIGQLARDAMLEPPSMARVAVPDYLHFGVLDTFRLFVAMTRFPALDTLLSLDVPVMAVLGVRDPLLPPASRIKDVIAQMHGDVTVAVIKDAAHAINFSHPRELAGLVRGFVDDTLEVGYVPTAHPDGPLSETVVLRPPEELRRAYAAGQASE